MLAVASLDITTLLLVFVIELLKGQTSNYIRIQHKSSNDSFKNLARLEN